VTFYPAKTLPYEDQRRAQRPVKKILILLASVPMLAIPAPAMAARQGPPFPHVCPFNSGFLGVEGGELVRDGKATQQEVDEADRNDDGLICYREVDGHNVILMEMLPF
jgi:hypothetical protein